MWSADVEKVIMISLSAAGVLLGFCIGLLLVVLIDIWKDRRVER